MKEKAIKLAIIAGALIGILCMYLQISSSISKLQEDVMVMILGGTEVTCLPETFQGNTIYVCSTPSYSDLKDYLESNR